MRYKLFFILFISGLLSIPQNSYTCGASEEPSDYFTSFFSRSVGAGKAYEPFYYTALLPFYDGFYYGEPDAANDRVVKEWISYTKSSSAAATQLVYNASRADLLALQSSASSGKPMPQNLTTNAAAKALVTTKNAAAIGYLAFARQAEIFSMGDGWSQKQNDSFELNKYISQATAGFTSATDAFLRNKWAFQRCKLSFYNNRFTDCIRFYNEAFNDAIPDAVQQLALSYKGGSEYKLGLNKEAAYSFSKAFPLSAQNKKSTYQGFLWATNYADATLLPTCLTLCKNNPERANLTALFALYGTAYNIAAIKQVHALNPASALLPLLATREINKLEEQWLTPNLAKEKGGKALYVNWVDEEEKKKAKSPGPVLAAAGLFEKLMADPAVVHRGVYGAGAAYLHYMLKDYSKARSLVAATKAINTEDKVTDQLSLISLLIIASEGKAISPATEAEMLPAIKWLAEKAKKDNEYAVFCRNFFSEVLAQKYEEQGDGAKAALAYGMADLKFMKRAKDEYFRSYSSAIIYVQEELSTADLLSLYQYTSAPQTEATKYFVQNGSVKKDNVVDVIGTSYLRDGNYTKAIEWLSKAGKLEPMVETGYNYTTVNERTLNVDPLHDYINDWQRLDKSATKPYTKLTLAQKLLELQTKADHPSATDDKAKAYYHLATALYNTSYYGNSWSAVAYFRSTYLWNEGLYKQPWEREYFGVYKARDWYQKAYEAATDKEFKAACLFMVVKCAQRQVVRPPYNYSDKEYDAKEKAFEKKFQSNPLFAKFRTEFGGTKYYQYVYNRCSYLRDYVAGSGGGRGPK